MGVKTKLNELPDDQELTLTKKDLKEIQKEAATSAVMFFIEQCKQMAEENWCSSMVFDLGRLFGAVVNGKPYAPEPEEE